MGIGAHGGGIRVGEEDGEKGGFVINNSFLLTCLINKKFFQLGFMCLDISSLLIKVNAVRRKI